MPKPFWLAGAHCLERQSTVACMYSLCAHGSCRKLSVCIENFPRLSPLEIWMTFVRSLVGNRLKVNLLRGVCVGGNEMTIKCCIIEYDVL